MKNKTHGNENKNKIRKGEAADNKRKGLQNKVKHSKSTQSS